MLDLSAGTMGATADRLDNGFGERCVSYAVMRGMPYVLR
jgi:hypothetical protein